VATVAVAVVAGVLPFQKAARREVIYRNPALLTGLRQVRYSGQAFNRRTKGDCASPVLKLKVQETSIMEKCKRTLSLHRPARYQIKVPGHLDESWSDWVGGLEMSVVGDEDGFPITTLTGSLDQAALQGLLRRLYSLGLPLASVNCIEGIEEAKRHAQRLEHERDDGGS
jgi:hypothetical protein